MNLVVGRVDRVEERRPGVGELSVDEVAEAAVAAVEPLHALGRALGRRAVVWAGEECQRPFGVDSHDVLLTHRDADRVRVVVATTLGVCRELRDEVVEERARSQPEQFGRGPGVVDRAELLVHHREPRPGLRRGADAASRLEADHSAQGHFRVEPADHPHHDQPDREGRVDRLHPGRGLDEVRARHHGDARGLRDHLVVLEVAGPEDDLQVGRAARVAHGHELVVELAPASSERELTSDDHVDLGGSGRDCGSDLGAALGQRGVLSVREVRGDRRDRDPTTEHAGRFRHLGRVDADRTDREGQLGEAECPQDLGRHRLERAVAQSVHPPAGVSAAQGGEVDATHQRQIDQHL